MFHALRVSYNFYILSVPFGTLSNQHFRYVIDIEFVYVMTYMYMIFRRVSPSPSVPYYESMIYIVCSGYRASSLAESTVSLMPSKFQTGDMHSANVLKCKDLFRYDVVLKNRRKKVK